MSSTEVISKTSIPVDGLKSKIESVVERSSDLYNLSLTTDIPGLVLHWGVAVKNSADWQLAPEDIRPAGTIAFDKASVQTPFVEQEPTSDGKEESTAKEGEKAAATKLFSVRMSFPQESSPLGIVFVIKRDKQWLKQRGQNIFVRILPPKKSPLADARQHKKTVEQVEPRSTFVLEDELGELDVYITQEESKYKVTLMTDAPSLVWHWGVAMRKKSEWSLCPSEWRPPGTKVFDEKAVQTFFPAPVNGISTLSVTEIPIESAPVGLVWVLKDESTGKWFKNKGGNFYVTISDAPRLAHRAGVDRTIVDAIIEAEVEYGSFTLMHRFNMCHDMLDTCVGDSDRMALLSTWLRYSYIRQLDWQRRYNTKPSELAFSQNRLTHRLAEIYANVPQHRDIVRMMIGTLGKGGGNGQRIRDEILHIMHRHGLPERNDTFMEQWHQKLHNNTTPDDVVICEGYLAFLHSDGNRDIFYGHLRKNGVTPERMASYDRAIRSAPDFPGHLKGGLIHDFEEYLRILKSVHSGTDLDTVANGARWALDGAMNNALNGVMGARGSGDVSWKMGCLTDFRRNLRNVMLHSSGFQLRDLLFLDLAVEEMLRLTVEGSTFNTQDLGFMVHAVGLVTENVCFSMDMAEMWDCVHQINRLKGTNYRHHEGYLHLKAITDRIKRIVGSVVERYTGLFQPKAEYLGEGCGLEKWVVTLFTEELLRGSPLFSLSTLLGKMDPPLRKCADLGNWQIISPGAGCGTLEIVDALISVQDKKYDQPTVMVALRISGEEEIPDGVSAVITPDQPDILSHCAVRARNQHVLFATCYSSDEIEAIKKLAGRTVSFTDNGGVVSYKEGAQACSTTSHQVANSVRKTITAPTFSSWTIPAAKFNKDVVGGKSNNLNGLRGRLPDWINLPKSAALPFGVCERVLEDPVNADLYKQYKALVPSIEANRGEVLAKLKDVITSLKAPKELVSAINKMMEETGLEFDGDWEDAWNAIRRVWASKWNDRAYISTKKAGIEQSEVVMAVLVQEVVEAEYAFVIHTTNPFTEDKDELYAECVVGLGETLVGNYPGRAFSFTCKKSDPKAPRIMGFPSKSAALFGGGLIFRSDSNGEDLEGYAGAGLYDSILMQAAKEVSVEYKNEKLCWDDKFRYEFMCAVNNIGLEIERTLGTPQDIEGAYSKGKYFVVQTRPQV
mmetsp:Transcript_44327/g.72138  ORF Transcript_44327/g.72138 Transcript_44327/m.72138 type:complete len:1178 (+) Transcript_44327:202-3735(+)|eukprot:CAMPEP_0184644182 /NCGR_PEP_ID=MMETSP0308-20130426/941_1 /TAXON_ID=38269 /ORGANISM="Gloeochaete witrockiana, Strain SAG 46.84" /LENGTH=1177 /DNA_ID=CAMNT_0027072575 /DNA_START=160 /DNA_END=3693 /DNA_ORIENTATION=+